MIFHPTRLPGVLLVELERIEDDRGHFARTWCREEFASRGLETAWAQCGTSWNRRRGTLRGLHFQTSPHEEVKLVRCTRGSIFDVVVDLRPESATLGRWEAFDLSADNGFQLLIPRACAHGFQTLEDDTEVFYQISAAYHAESSRGVRWDDEALAIPWPIPDPILSDRDRRHPSLAGSIGSSRNLSAVLES